MKRIREFVSLAKRVWHGSLYVIRFLLHPIEPCNGNNLFNVFEIEQKLSSISSPVQDFIRDESMHIEEKCSADDLSGCRVIFRDIFRCVVNRLTWRDDSW